MLALSARDRGSEQESGACLVEPALVGTRVTTHIDGAAGAVIKLEQQNGVDATGQGSACPLPPVQDNLKFPGATWRRVKDKTKLIIKVNLIMHFII